MLCNEMNCEELDIGGTNLLLYLDWSDALGSSCDGEGWDH